MHLTPYHLGLQFAKLLVATFENISPYELFRLTMDLIDQYRQMSFENMLTFSYKCMSSDGLYSNFFNRPINPDTWTATATNHLDTEKTLWIFKLQKQLDVNAFLPSKSLDYDGYLFEHIGMSIQTAGGYHGTVTSIHEISTQLH
uniref:Peptidase_M1 domain-containing protein n=1 Tax=Rhabditophanes sp. KR3021 TaxID=114890 RepID=A0AC35TIN3_9BILA